MPERAGRLAARCIAVSEAAINDTTCLHLVVGAIMEIVVAMVRMVLQDTLAEHQIQDILYLLEMETLVLMVQLEIPLML